MSLIRYICLMGMPFGLCNAPATFQRCMLAIFHDMIEESIKVFMDDFFVFGNSFDKCLNNLDKMLQRCKDAHLVQLEKMSLHGQRRNCAWTQVRVVLGQKDGKTFIVNGHQLKLYHEEEDYNDQRKAVMNSRSRSLANDSLKNYAILERQLVLYLSVDESLLYTTPS
ncbi:reverse transcriptase domain-containing protein, partial [Tanacetum coccineum]